MAEPVTTFFDAWQVASSDERLAMIRSAVSAGINYTDPRTPETIDNVNALSEYVGMFSANAPGWSATVVNSDTVGGITRATVAFGGPGPDGKEMVQLGQYYIEFDQSGDGDGQISRMIGFVGTGSPT